MRNRRLRKGLTAGSLSAAMMLAGSSFAFGAAQALPDGTIVDQGGGNLSDGSPRE